VGDYRIEMVKKFVYLGVCLTGQNGVLQEIRGRIETANRAYFPIVSLIVRRDISWRFPVMLHKPLIGRIVLHGSETEHVARMGEWRGAYKILVRKPERKRHLKDLDVDGRTILICFLKN
jgi:hypothetical protein